MEPIGYWALKPRERALLDAEALKQFTGVELMRLGIPRAVLPVYEPVPEITPATEVRAVAKLGFNEYACQDEVSAARLVEVWNAAQPRSIGSTYGLGADFVYVHDAEREASYTKKPVVPGAEYDRVRRAVDEVRSAKERNKKLQSAYEAAVESEDAAIQELRDDWQNQCAHERRAQAITSTWAEYVENCKGDEVIAAVFLLKRYTDSEIKFAFEWLGMPIPQLDPPCVAEPVGVTGPVAVESDVPY